MELEHIFGNDKVKTHLLDALKNGRIPHAQIFCGPEGSGTLPMAIAYIKTIIQHIKNGKWQEDSNPYGDLKVEKLIHPDLHFSFPINSTDSISAQKLVSDDFIHLWREAVLKKPYMNLNSWYNHIGLLKTQGIMSVHESSAIMKKLTLKPFESEYKFMVIWMAERINQPAANKLLKLLEEPPEKTIFILIAQSTEQILPTILSRCQLVQFSSIDTQSMKKAIESSSSLNETQLNTIIRLSEGNLNKAFELIRHDKQIEFNHENFSIWMRFCFKKDMASIFKWLDKMNRQNRENLKLFLQYGLHVFRESIILNYGGPELQLIEETENGFIKKFSKYVTANNCQEFVSAFESALFDIGRNCNSKIVLMDVSLIILTNIHPKK